MPYEAQPFRNITRLFQTLYQSLVLKQTNAYGNARSERQVQDIFEKKRIYLNLLNFFSYVFIQGTSLDSCQKFYFCSLYVTFFVTFKIHNSLPIQKSRKSPNLKKNEVVFPLSQISLKLRSAS
jgi:hypothetical protein